MRLATNYDRMHSAGAEVAAISVDDESRQAAMAERWGSTHTRFVADPGGDEYLRPLDLFDPEDRGGIALPGMLLIDPEGREVYRYQGRDFADRTHDEDLWDALDALQLPSVQPDPWVPEVEPASAPTGAFPRDHLAPYFRGNMFGAIAIQGRVGDDDHARRIAKEHRHMAKATLDAWKEWRPNLT